MKKENINMKSPKLSKVADTIPEFYVLKIDAIANDLISQGKKVIKLNLGKSELPMSNSVTKELIQKMRDTKKREIINPQGLLELREEIARDAKITHKAFVKSEQIFINNGTSPFFLQLFLLLLNKGEEALLPKPYYPTYVANANISGIKKSFYKIKNGRIDLIDFKKKFKKGKTKLVLLNSPGNPFGNVLTKKELQEILRIVDGQAYVVSDEIYDGFVYDGNFTSILNIAKPSKDKVIVLNGFSKIHHMYTRRLGYAIVPHTLIEPMLRYQQHNVVCVDPVTQFAGLVSLKNKEGLIKKEIKKEVQEYKKRLEACRELITKTRLRLIEPAGSFYMCVDVSNYLRGSTRNSLSLAKKILKDTGVAVTPGEDFGMDNFFRISLTSSEVVEGVKKMCDYLIKK